MAPTGNNAIDESVFIMMMYVLLLPNQQMHVLLIINRFIHAFPKGSKCKVRDDSRRTFSGCRSKAIWIKGKKYLSSWMETHEVSIKLKSIIKGTYKNDFLLLFYKKKNYR